jgi:hypothetical protein
MSKKYPLVEEVVDVRHDDALQYEGPYASAGGAPTSARALVAPTVASAPASRRMFLVNTRSSLA